MKESSCLKPLGLEPWYLVLVSPGWPQPSLFKLSSWGQKWLCSGGHMFYIGLYREKQVCWNYVPWTMPLGPKVASPHVSPGKHPAFNRYLYVSFKQISGEWFSTTRPSCFYLNNQCRPWCDATFCGMSSLSSLFSKVLVSPMCPEWKGKCYNKHVQYFPIPVKFRNINMWLFFSAILAYIDTDWVQ